MLNEESKRLKEQENSALPVTKAEDVEFSRELADDEDLEALQRMEAADRRQEENP